MNKPGDVEPWEPPSERLYGMAPEPDIDAALILLVQTRLRVPPGLSVVRAALNVAETGLLEAQAAERDEG